MKYDVTILGGTINGLIAAAYLSKAKKKVCIIEKNSTLGGVAGSGDDHNYGLLQDASTFSKRVFTDLDLKNHGLNRSEQLVAVGLDPENRLLLGDSTHASVVESLTQYCPEDVEGYKKFYEFIRLFKPMVEKVMGSELPNIGNMNISTAWEVGGLGLSLRSKGKRAMNELLRAIPMCSADFLHERFAFEPLKAGLAVPSVSGNLLGPWSPATNALLLSYYGLKNQEIEGGPAALVGSLKKLCQSSGVDFLMDTQVQCIKTSDGEVKSLDLSNGESMPVHTLMSALDVKTTFLKKLDRCPLKLRKRIEDFRMRGTTAHIHFQLNDVPLTENLKNHTLRMHLCESIDGLEKSFDPIKYKQLPETPLVELDFHSQKGQVNSLVHFVPYELKGGWNEESKSQLIKTVVGKIQQYMPGFGDSIDRAICLTPAEIESKYEVWGGQIQGGEFGLDQAIMRPVPELVDYTTPFKNMFMCSESNHPGGFITGTAPRIASAKLLKAL